MSTLSSLLIQRRVASMRVVEEAIARQVLHGGDLLTNLLEVAEPGSVDESALSRVLAEHFGLAPAPAGRLLSPSVTILSAVPPALALRLSIFPLAKIESTLVLAAAEALSESAVSEIEALFGAPPRVLVAPRVRVRQALSAYFDVPLERREVRLLAKLDGVPDPLPPSIAPPPGGFLRVPMPSSMPPPNFGPLSRRAVRVPTAPGLPDVSALLDAGPKLDDAGVVASAASKSAGADLLTQAETPSSGTTMPRADKTLPSEAVVQSGAVLPAVPVHQSAAEPPPADIGGGAASEATRAGRGESDAPKQDASARLIRDSGRAQTIAALLPGARARRRRGPLTAVEAEKELGEAESSDDVLDTFYAFARQYFVYSALFVVHGDIAEGREASGPGADRSRVRALGVPLDLPSALSRARARKAPIVAPLDSDGLDLELQRDLGRTGASEPSTAVAVIPLAVRSRCVALLFGDDLPDPVEMTSFGDVIALGAVASAALERIIVRKKIEGRKLAAPPAASVQAPIPKRAQSAAPPRSPEALGGVLTAPKSLGAASPPDASPRDAAAPERKPPSSNAVRALHNASPTLGSQPSQAPSIGLSPRSYTPLAIGVSIGARSVSPPALDGAAEPPPRAALAPPRVPAWVDPLGDLGDGVVAPAANSGATAATSGEPVGASRAGNSKPPPAGEGLAIAIARAIDQPAAAAENASDRPPRRSQPPPARRSVPPIPREEAAEGRPSKPPAPDRVDARSETDWSARLDQIVRGGPGSDAAFADVVKNAEHSLPAVISRFPGPLLVDRHRWREELPMPSRCGPILELLVAIRRPALPFVTVRSANQADVEDRFWATHVLGELRFTEAANAVLPRLFDDDVSVRRVARRSASALVNAGTAGQPIVLALDHMTRDEAESLARRLLAIETMGEIRTPSLVPSLIAVLADESELVSEAARRALLLTTRQDLGRDTDRWFAWYQAHAHEHRIEWLIDALMNEVPPLRRAAADELKQITKQYFGYYDDLPRRERERAQARYREWWTREGRHRFE